MCMVVADIYERVQFDTSTNKNPDLADLNIFWFWIRFDRIKGDCEALAEVCALLSAILIRHISAFFICWST